MNEFQVFQTYDDAAPFLEDVQARNRSQLMTLDNLARKAMGDYETKGLLKTEGTLQQTMWSTEDIAKATEGYGEGIVVPHPVNLSTTEILGIKKYDFYEEATEFCPDKAFGSMEKLVLGIKARIDKLEKNYGGAELAPNFYTIMTVDDELQQDLAKGLKELSKEKDLSKELGFLGSFTVRLQLKYASRIISLTKLRGFNNQEIKKFVRLAEEMI